MVQVSNADAGGIMLNNSHYTKGKFHAASSVLLWERVLAFVTTVFRVSASHFISSHYHLDRNTTISFI